MAAQGSRRARLAVWSAIPASGLLLGAAVGLLTFLGSGARVEAAQLEAAAAGSRHPSTTGSPTGSTDGSGVIHPPATVQSTLLKGRVRDATGLGLASVRLEVYADGLRRAEARTGADGDFAFVVNWREDGDPTVVLLAELHAPYVPEIVLLRESAAARASGVWGTILPRVTVDRRETRVDLTMHTARERWRPDGIEAPSENAGEHRDREGEE